MLKPRRRDRVPVKKKSKLDEVYETYGIEDREKEFKESARTREIQARKWEQDEKWETDRLIASGVQNVGKRSLKIDNEQDVSVKLLVHQITPPFLSGQTIYTKHLTKVKVVKDSGSDMCKIARNGSQLLKFMRDEKERKKMQAKFWEMGNTKMGDVLGMKEKKKKKHIPTVKLSDEQKNANRSEFARNKTIKEQREYLPIFTVRNKLIQIVRHNQIVIIVGQTGSGKTTQLTQYLYEEGFAKGGIICCTQPRRVAATSVAARVSQEVGVELGDEVGYTIRFDDMSSRKTKIKYMTDGILLRESLRDADLDQYSVIIMDEAHERSLNTDILFGLLKRVIRRRRDLRLIVTSATLNSEKFSKFFGNAPVFEIPGRTFKVTVHHTNSPQEDYVQAAADQAIKVHLNPEVGFDGDILVFMTGQEDIDAVKDYIDQKMEAVTKKARPLETIPMYAQLPNEKQQQIFKPSDTGARKCIISTNIAETSVTVDGVCYVIDSGFCKLKVVNPKIGMDTLIVTPISQANANQRAGRAGRTSEGLCYRMYTKYSYLHEFLSTTVPEVQRTNLGNVVLLLKSLGIANLITFDFMDPPPQENIVSSLYQLWVLGALDHSGNLTKMGRHMVEYPLDPTLSKMLIKSVDENCSAEVLTIVAMLSVPPVFYRPPNRAEEADSKRDKFAVPESDHLTLLHVYQQWKKHGFKDSWCKEYFIEPKRMRRAREVREQLMEIMKSRNIEIVSCNHDWDKVRRAICSAYFHNAAKLKGFGKYVNIKSGIPCNLHPSSALFGSGSDKQYLVYHELVLTTKEWMRTVTAVDPEWLAELGPTFFSVQKDYTSILEHKQREKVLVEQMKEALEARKKRDKEARLKKHGDVRQRMKNDEFSWKDQYKTQNLLGKRKVKKEAEKQKGKLAESESEFEDIDLFLKARGTGRRRKRA